MKRHWRGTHRTVEPSETLARVLPHAQALGITRLANVTGLDYLGLPVFMATRPNARSLSVAQGKGLDLESARVSAFMEAAESAHAEEPSRGPLIETYLALRARQRVADPVLLPQRKDNIFRPDREIAWIGGKAIPNGEDIWVPYDLVHLDYTIPRRHVSSGFLTSSNGLASGNHPLEALCSGLYELVERDAMVLWRFRGSAEQAKRRLVNSSVTDGDCRTLLDRLAECGMSVAIWDLTTDIRVATFLCRLREAPGNTRSGFGAFWGSGCHLSREIALSRAITEAAQSRLTSIAGSRDDLRVLDYAEPEHQALFDLVLDLHQQKTQGWRFEDVPTFWSASFEEDLETLVSLLKAANLDEIIAVDLTRSSIEIPVVRVIVPGLETWSHRGSCKTGFRVRALQGEQP